jgi:hypothetical protein
MLLKAQVDYGMAQVQAIRSIALLLGRTCGNAAKMTREMEVELERLQRADAFFYRTTNDHRSLSEFLSTQRMTRLREESRRNAERDQA